MQALPSDAARIRFIFGWTQPQQQQVVKMPSFSSWRSNYAVFTLLLIALLFEITKCQQYEISMNGIWAIKPGVSYSLKRRFSQSQTSSVKTLIVGGWMRSTSMARFELENLEDEFQICQPSGPGSSQVLTKCVKSTSGTVFTPHFASQQWVFILFTYSNLQYRETIFSNPVCEPATLDAMYTSAVVYTSGGGQSSDDLEVEIPKDGESNKVVNFPVESFIQYYGLFIGVVPTSYLNSGLLPFLMSGFSRGVDVRKNFPINQNAISLAIGSYVPQIFLGTEDAGGKGVLLEDNIQYLVELNPALLEQTSTPDACRAVDVGFKTTMIPGSSVEIWMNLGDTSNNQLLPTDILLYLEQEATPTTMCKLKKHDGEVVIALPLPCASIYIVMLLCNSDVLTSSGSPNQSYQPKLTQNLLIVVNKLIGVQLNPQDNGGKLQFSSFKKLRVKATGQGITSKLFLDFTTAFSGGIIDPSSISSSRQYSYTSFGSTFSISGASTSLLRSFASSSFNFWGAGNYITGESDPVYNLNCPAGTYLSDRHGCATCHPACGKCFGDSHTECKTCTTTTFEVISGSASSCQRVGSVPFGQSSNGMHCPQNCDLCTGTDGQICTACTTGSYLLEGVGTCGTCTTPGFYIGRDNLCKKCHSNCTTCDDEGPLSCTSCPDGKVLSDSGECVACDQQGTYFSPGKCEKCHESCLTCKSASATNCLSCRSSLYLYRNGTCGLCPQAKGLFFNSLFGFCEKCDPSCKTCNGSTANSCLTCYDGYDFQKQSCIQKSFSPGSKYFDRSELSAYLSFDLPIQKVDLSLLKSTTKMLVFSGKTEQEILALLKAKKGSRMLSEGSLSAAASVPQLLDYSLSYYGDRALRLQLHPGDGSLQRSTIVVELSNPSLLSKEGDSTTIYPDPYIIVPDVEYTYTSFDRLLDNAVLGFSITNGVIMLVGFFGNFQQCVQFLKMLQILRTYLLVSMIYPTNFERLLRCVSSDPILLFPNFFYALGDENGVSLPPRFPRYGYSLQIFRTVCALLSFALVICLLKTAAWLASRTPAKPIQKVGLRLNKKLGPEFWFGLLEANHISILLGMLIFVAQRDSLPNRGFDQFLIILTSLSFLALLSWYLFIYRKVLSLHETFVRLAILEVDELPDEPFSYLLEGKQELKGMFRRHFSLTLLLRDVLTAVLIFTCKNKGDRKSTRLNSSH